MARILITGITGQDGSYLTESHLATGDEVHGLVRQSSLMQRTRLDALPAVVAAREEGRLKLHYADLSDTSSLVAVLRAVKPDVIYHLAGQSHVKISFDLPEYTADSTGLGTLRLLEAVRSVAPDARLFLAATSEIFGEPARVAPDREDADEPDQPVRGGEGLRAEPRADLPEGVRPLRVRGDPVQPREPAPRRELRDAEDRPRRGAHRAREAEGAAPRDARAAAGLELRARHRRGHAPDRRGPERPDDFVLASGVSHSVGDFCKAAFAVVGLDFRRYVVLDAEYVRPIDISETRGDASKARRELGWVPKTGFDALVRLMVEAEVAAVDGSGDAA